jgi:hypothetical protein
MNKKDVIGCGTTLLIAALALIFSSTLVFGLGCLGGLLLKLFVGQPVANGLNMVLGNIMQYNFTPDDIPLFCGIMTTIGGFFKTSISTSKNN